MSKSSDRPSTVSTSRGSQSGHAGGGKTVGNMVLYDIGDTLAKKSLMFTGPDNLRHHRVRVVNDAQFVGQGERSEERSSAINYLFRGPKNAPFPKAKNGRIGEIGWEAEHLKDGKIVY